ncbi:MAG TPA: MFS transporter [Woeseiaceae bacterium]
MKTVEARPAGDPTAPVVPGAGAGTATEDLPRERPRLGFWQIWNMSFGFFGIQFGFALQNANVSRIFQTLGASMDDLPILWIAAPATGLLVQPVIGYLSDRTWGRFGRRRPYFLAGAILASAALLVMPASPALWVAAGMLWVMDASINVSMEPFRAFVGDLLPERQRTAGFAMQSFFIGTGAVIASALPWLVTNWLGVENTAAPGEIPDSVKLAFYVGAAVFLGAVAWTVSSTREYSPAELAAFEAASPEGTARVRRERGPAAWARGGMAWLGAGAALFAAVGYAALEKELYVLAGGVALFGLLQLVRGRRRAKGRSAGALSAILDDLFAMPRVMRQLAVVQFFSWFGLFAMWIYGTAAVTSHHYGTSDVTSQLYNDGADWVGVLFGAYNGFAALAAVAIPFAAARLGCRGCHAANLAIGGVCLASFWAIRDPALLLWPMVGVGLAWASILSLPYVLLSCVLPAGKLGVYMGIFNFFIVIPQLVAASVLGILLSNVFGGQSIFMLVTGGASLALAGVATLLVDPAAEPTSAAPV